MAKKWLVVLLAIGLAGCRTNESAPKTGPARPSETAGQSNPADQAPEPVTSLDPDARIPIYAVSVGEASEPGHSSRAQETALLGDLAGLSGETDFGIDKDLIDRLCSSVPDADNPRVVVLIDNSMSMSLPDDGQEDMRTRLERLRAGFGDLPDLSVSEMPVLLLTDGQPSEQP